MSQLSRAAMRWGRLIKTAQPNRRLPSTFFTFPKPFSTESAEPSLGSSNDQYIRTSSSVSIYGKFGNITKLTTKNDVINLLEGCELNPENLRVEYNRTFRPTSMMIEFPSGSAYDDAVRAINRKGRLHSLTRVDKSYWDSTTPQDGSAPYDGKAILLSGIPHNALLEDVERFLSGCQYYSSSVTFFIRPLSKRAVRMVVVRFPSQALAMHAYITKNRGFCLNEQITVQVLH
ncbi:hypothetical protein OROHE_023773 [Orobanche hederae]